MFTSLVYLVARYRGELRAVWVYREPRATLRQDEKEEVAGASMSNLREKEAVGLLSGGKVDAE
jgi:hypothetical protein